MINITLETEPIPWQRPGQRTIGGKTIRYDKQAKEKEQLRWQIRSQYAEEPISAACAVTILFYRAIPKGTSKKKTEQMKIDFIKPMCRPDLDNYQKFILDCLNGLVYRDDSQVTELTSKKLYSEHPRVVISVVPFINNPVIEPVNTDPIDDIYV